MNTHLSSHTTFWFSWVHLKCLTFVGQYFQSDLHRRCEWVDGRWRTVSPIRSSFLALCYELLVRCWLCSDGLSSPTKWMNDWQRGYSTGVTSFNCLPYPPQKKQSFDIMSTFQTGNLVPYVNKQIKRPTRIYNTFAINWNMYLGPFGNIKLFIILIKFDNRLRLSQPKNEIKLSLTNFLKSMSPLLYSRYLLILDPWLIYDPNFWSGASYTPKIHRNNYCLILNVFRNSVSL